MKTGKIAIISLALIGAGLGIAYAFKNSKKTSLTAGNGTGTTAPGPGTIGTGTGNGGGGAAPPVFGGANMGNSSSDVKTDGSASGGVVGGIKVPPAYQGGPFTDNDGVTYTPPLIPVPHDDGTTGMYPVDIAMDSNNGGGAAMQFDNMLGGGGIQLVK